MTPRTATPPPRASAIARFGPLTGVLAAIALVAVLSSTGRATDRTDDRPSEIGSAVSQLPITYQEATGDGTVSDRDWGDACDPETGRVRIPSVYAPPCVLPRPGVEGGATYRGVTEDTIKIVSYLAPDDDLSAALQSKLDSDADQREYRERVIEMMSATHELWGRRIEVVYMKGSGSDETSARADAVKVADEIGAFASIGGPGQQSAYAEQLAAEGVVCINCGLSMPDSTLQRNAPYLWGIAQTPEQYLLNVGDYMVRRMMGKPASFGGPDVADRERVFGIVHFEQDPPVFEEVEAEAAARGAEHGYESAVNLTYQLVLPDLPEKARVLVARLKEAGVTTVVFMGDPIMPGFLTRAATDQNYYPEWVITGTVLTDTSALGRTYDQAQWRHAFGLSGLPVRLVPQLREAWRLHDWYFGEPPAAAKVPDLIYEPLRLFFLGVHLAGPNLTPESFRDGLFSYPPSGGSPLYPRVSFGDRGLFDNPDYTTVDDMQEIWWDADAVGPDDQGVEGTGLMRFAEGGRRFLPGEMSDDPPRAFESEGSVTAYQEIPADQAPPDYPPPPGSPAAP